jgi:glycosyl transferase family 25
MAPLTDTFALTRVVNLPARKDRYREISAQLNALGMPFATGKVELFPAVCPSEAAGFTNAAVRGCYLSHLEILRDARDRGVTSVLMIEDDLHVQPQDVEELSRIAAQLADRFWGIAYLGHFHPTPPAATPGWLPFDGELRTSHFYAVHSSVFDRLIAYLEACLTRPPGDPVGGPMEYDGALNMFRRWNPDVVTLIAQPSLGGQRSSRSDIHPGRLEQLPGAGSVISLLRRAKRALHESR